VIRVFSRFLLLVALTVGTISIHGHVEAQDATPATEASAPGDGVRFMPIGGADGVTVPNPAMLLAVRVQMEPGATAPLVAGNASSGLFMVEAGAFTVQIDAPWSLTRSASAGGQLEAPAAGDVVELKAGDVAYVPADVAGELRNDDDLPAIGVMFLVAPASPASATIATPEP
jgi:quercetin dioxygenase-like cupin family protein